MQRILLLLLAVTLIGCASSRSPVPGAVEARLVLPDSTVTEESGFPVEVHLTNIARYPLQLPDRVYFTSDLHPNGLDLDHTGLLVHFEIKPKPEAFMLIEPPHIGPVEDYERLQAGETRVIEYNLKKHLRCKPGEPATGVSDCPGEWMLSSGQYKLSAEIAYSGGGFTIPLPCEAWRGKLFTEKVPFELK